MKVLFLFPACESLSVESLAAVTRRAGHTPILIFDPCLFDDTMISMPAPARVFSFEKRLVRRIQDAEPDLIAFSVLTNTYTWFKRLGRAARAVSHAPIIAGNIHISSAPEHVLKNEFVDGVVRGEGEGAFIDILDCLSENPGGEIRRDIENFGYRNSDGTPALNSLRPLINDLDTLPFPDKSIYSHTPFDSSDVYTIMGARGCPFKCSYCNNSLMKKLYGDSGYLRFRSVDNILDELEFAKKTYRPRYVNFFDEVFGVKRGWLEEFAEKYPARIGLPYLITSHPSSVDADYVRRLRESGCTKVALGVQTINQEKRRNVFLRTETNEQIREAITLLKKNNIVVSVDNILNFPGETEADLEEMVRFYNRTRPDVIQPYWLTYYPGTAIVDMARERGALSDADVKNIAAGRGGTMTMSDRPRPMQKKFFLLLILLRLLPPSWVNFFLEHRLHRYFPSWIPPEFAYMFQGIFLRRSPLSKLLLNQQVRRYKAYLVRFFFPRGQNL